MTKGRKAQMAEAVLFFDEHGIRKQLLYPEFEAVLDGVVDLPEFADQQVRAAYLSIDPQLRVRAAVFFCIDFLEQGEADRGWNLPLRALAEQGKRGPDLGAGAIRLVCRHQCPIPWQQMHLWDPDDRLLALIRDRIRDNQLRLLVAEEPVPAAAAEPGAMAAEGVAAPAPNPVVAELEQTLAELHLCNEREQARLSAQVDALQQRLQALLLENARLGRLVEQQAERLSRQQEEMAHYLRELEASEQAEAEAVRAEFARKAQAQAAAAVQPYKDRVAALEAELACRSQLDAALQEECERLVRERDALAQAQPPSLLDRLARLGINFVVYHPGAGQFSIPFDDIEHYEADPLAYVAARCKVTPVQYRQWLDHYMQPYCSARLINGEPCALPVDRIDQPGRFVPGISDCCARHRAEPLLASGR